MRAYPQARKFSFVGNQVEASDGGWEGDGGYHDGDLPGSPPSAVAARQPCSAPSDEEEEEGEGVEILRPSAIEAQRKVALAAQEKAEDDRRAMEEAAERKELVREGREERHRLQEAADALQRVEAIAIFEAMDVDGDGQLGPEEISAALEELGYLGDAADGLVFVLDTNCDGYVSREEFIHGFESFHRLGVVRVEYEEDSAEQVRSRSGAASWERKENSAAIVLDRGGGGFVQSNVAYIPASRPGVPNITGIMHGRHAGGEGDVESETNRRVPGEATFAILHGNRTCERPQARVWLTAFKAPPAR